MNYLENKTTNKTFGTFFSVFFLLFAVYFIIDGRDFFWYFPFLMLATVFYLLRTFFENLLQPLNNGWFWIGCFIGRFTTGILFTIIFYMLISPIALITKFFRRDILRLRIKPNVESYWINRTVDGRSFFEYFKNQF